MEYFTLNDGREIPAIGLGSYNPTDLDFSEIIRQAVDLGYRLFDTASLYGTEKAVGKGLAACGLKREEYILQSKLWIDEMGYDNVMQAFNRTMERLRTEYLDVYFIHWPRAYQVYSEVPGHGDVSQNKLPYKIQSEWKALLLETYGALEELYDKKLIRGIGLSNFLPHHIMPILENCRIKPVLDQLELHIGHDQPAARAYAGEKGIVCQAWSPLARGILFRDGFLNTMAEKYHVSVAQLALRYLYQAGIVSIPKASSAEKMKANLDIFSFEISQEDYYLLACMVPAFWCMEHPDFRMPGRLSQKTV